MVGVGGGGGGGVDAAAVEAAAGVQSSCSFSSKLPVAHSKCR